MIKLASAALLRALAYMASREPTLRRSLGLAFLVCIPIYVRSVFTNFIFDEQEALLANPYVNGDGLPFWAAFERDFWGLPPERSIGSYRPLPNLIWRPLWMLAEHPWPAHVVNLALHALNASLLAGFAWRFSGERLFAWLAGAVFLLAAILTEAICGVVGVADILAGTAALLALRSLQLPLGRLWLVAIALFVGLLAKESVLGVLPVLPWAALLVGRQLGERCARSWFRALCAAAFAALALVAYTQLRRRLFLGGEARELLQASGLEGAELLARGLDRFLSWFAQPKLPLDPINNPLAQAELPARIGGALRVYWRGLTQVVWPSPLSGDYSFAQEPARALGHWLEPEAVLGGLALIVPLGIGLVYGALALWSRRVPTRQGLWLGDYVKALLGLCCVWLPATYLPHSNLLVLLPTVRAERLWYLPVIATSLIIGWILTQLLARGGWVAERAASVDNVFFPGGSVSVFGSNAGFSNAGSSGSGSRFARSGSALVVCAFFTCQAFCARRHALHYNNDLVFWEATTVSSPASAKAHLNYGVMLGARGRLSERLRESERAAEIAPEWPMAHVYLADTLCRLEQIDRAWPHYVRAFRLAPNDQSLIALSLQCLWDKGGIPARTQEIQALAEAHPGSWLAYLGRDIIINGKQHDGVEQRYRPRGYDEPAKDESEAAQPSVAGSP